MERLKGGKNRRWTVEEKLRIVNSHLEDHISVSQVAREENINNGMLSTWVSKYIDGGESALAAKPVNPYAVVHTGRNLFIGKKEPQVSQTRRRKR